MQYVEAAMLFLGDIPVFGWWAVTPLALVCGALFWNALSCFILFVRWVLSGRKAVFRSKRQKTVFLIFVVGTSVLELSMSLYTMALYYRGFMLQDHGYPFFYFMALCLILISAVFFFCYFISSVCRLRARRN